MAYFPTAMELALRPLRADGSYRTKGRSDMGEDGTFDAWRQIQVQLDVVEACAGELDPKASGRVVALRQQVAAWRGLQRPHESAGGQDESAGLIEIVQGVLEVVRDLREILALKGSGLSTTANHLTSGSDVASGVVGRTAVVLVEIDEKLFRVSNSMWDVLRSME
jgi:hypothetical protein